MVAVSTEAFVLLPTGDDDGEEDAVPGREGNRQDDRKMEKRGGGVGDHRGRIIPVWFTEGQLSPRLGNGLSDCFVEAEQSSSVLCETQCNNSRTGNCD